MMPQKFFITHSWEDIAFARKLCDGLKVNGLDGFFDMYSIRLGDNIAARIARGLDECDVYVPILSPAALKSQWCEEEINLAITLSKERERQGRPRIIPVIAEECKIPILLHATLNISFVGWKDEGVYQNALNNLLTNGFGLPDTIEEPKPQSPAKPKPESPATPTRPLQPVTPQEPAQAPPRKLSLVEILTPRGELISGWLVKVLQEGNVSGGIVIIAILACLGSYLMLPQVRVFIASVQATPTAVAMATLPPTSSTPRPISLTITAPTNDARVGYRPFIEGTVSDSEATVWVIVHQMAMSAYFVQPSMTARGDGTWKVQAYVGEQNAGIGEYFEIMAVVNPQQPLKEGQQLPGWPTAQSKSNVIEVIRSDSRVIFWGGNLSAGYDMVVNTSGGQTNWVTQKDDAMCMAYPSGQDWGSVFITVGKPVNPPRPSQDLSKYGKLALELRGDAVGKSVLVGLKDNTDPDDGSETKIRADLTTDWKAFEFPLSGFKTADLRNLYVVTEFVFERTPGTVCFRNIQFLP